MVEAVKKEDPRIYDDRFSLHEHRHFIHNAILENHIAREHIVRPEFWSHVSGKITVGDRIIARNDAFTYWAELLAIDVGSGFVKVHVLRWESIESSTDADAGTPDDYTVEFKGAERLHVVIRKSDGRVLQEKLRTRTDAEAWITGFIGATPKQLKAA